MAKLHLEFVKVPRGVRIVRFVFDARYGAGEVQLAFQDQYLDPVLRPSRPAKRDV